AAEAARPEPEVVEAAGSRISYLRLGEGSPPLVLVHGFGGDLNNWLFNQPALAAGRATYALDLPGHGRSSKDVGGGDSAALARVLAAFLDALRLERVHLVGHSLGGAIALDLAVRQPQRVASLTLIAPAAMGGEINADYIAGFIAAGRRNEMRAVLGLLFAEAALVSRDMVDEVLKYKRLDGVAAALAAIAGAAFPGGRQSRNLKSCLADLPMPVQVIWGRQDRILPVAQSEGLPAAIPLHVLEEAGHMAHMEAAARVNALIEDFLRR
ncbi:MAG TPA: acetoin dehydrogenase dihydrolipoyllysine-residue acetyltransferase subunit, partial [Kiloniellales bacterium]